jgi:CarD family transcriptional regulator
MTKNDKSFKKGDFIVYPAHGVGRVTGVEKDSVAGFDIEVYVVTFEQDKMTLRVPTAKTEASGMRPLSSDRIVKDALKTLKGKAKVKRTMWSRRAQEYEAKINSGNPVSIAEVVRDLHRNVGQPDQSFSERQIYEAARDRLAAELAAVDKTDVDKATEKLEKVLRAA